MQAGKYIFIDIGQSETKILEASIKSHEIVVHKSAEMRDMSLCVSSSNMIQQIEGFCLSLKKTLEDAGIRTRTAIVCSSILGITTTDLTSEMKTVKECTARFEKNYGRSTNYSKINDWQYMGEIISETSIQQRIMMSTGSIYLIKSFVEAMSTIAGITVQGLESGFTAQANLHALFSMSFDLPSIAFFDIGSSSVHCQYFKNDTFVTSEEADLSFLKLYQRMAETLHIPQPKMKNIIYNIGCVENETNKSALAKAGIAATDYYTTLTDILKEFAVSVQEHIASVAISKKLDNVRLVLTGGLAAIPGFKNVFPSIYNYTPCTVLEFEPVFTTKQFKLVNKLNCILQSKFANCVGMMLKGYNSYHTVNLVPKELMVIDSGRILNVFTMCAQVVAIASLIGVLAMNAMPILSWSKKLQIPERLETAQNELRAEKQTNSKLVSYIDSLNSINNSLTPFVSFVCSCENKDIRIASIDSANILDATIVVNTENDEKEEELTDTNTDTTALDALIIRGYASNSAAVTTLYSKLSENDNVSSINMNGISEVAISSSETIFIFEISVEVLENG